MFVVVDGSVVVVVWRCVAAEPRVAVLLLVDAARLRSVL